MKSQRCSVIDAPFTRRGRSEKRKASPHPKQHSNFCSHKPLGLFTKTMVNQGCSSWEEGICPFQKTLIATPTPTSISLSLYLYLHLHLLIASSKCSVFCYNSGLLIFYSFVSTSLSSFLHLATFYLFFSFYFCSKVSLFFSNSIPSVDPLYLKILTLLYPSCTTSGLWQRTKDYIP